MAGGATDPAVLDLLAPGARVVARDQEWQVEEVERSALGGRAVVRCVGHSELVRGEPVDDLEGEIERQVGYRSLISGEPPTVMAFPTAAGEARAVADRIAGWLAAGIAPSSIGVCARTRADLTALELTLDEDGVAWSHVGGAARTPAVQVGTMHSSKGLEYARLAVIAVNRDNLPLPAATTPASEDPEQHALDVQRERSLLYVACTRARDELVITSSGSPSQLLPKETSAHEQH